MCHRHLAPSLAALAAQAPHPFPCRTRRRYVNHYPSTDDPFGVLPASDALSDASLDDGTSFAFLIGDHGLAQVYSI